MGDLKWGQIKAFAHCPYAALWALGQGHSDQGIVVHVERDPRAHRLVHANLSILAWLRDHEIAQLSVAEHVHQVQLAFHEMGVQVAS